VSYLERKQERDRALIESIHGPLGPSPEQLSEGSFDGGAMTDCMPRAEPRPLPPAGEPRELGWGEGVVIEDGAKLFFGGLGDG
jgi:hypothetical protein